MMRSGLKQDPDAARLSMVADRMVDRSADFQYLEGIEGQAGMMALGIGQASDRIEQRLVD